MFPQAKGKCIKPFQHLMQPQSQNYLYSSAVLSAVPPFLIHCTEFNLYYRQNPQQYLCYNAPTHSSTQKGEKVIRLLRGKIALAILQMFLSAYVSSHSFLTWPLFFSHLSIFLFQSNAVPSLLWLQHTCAWGGCVTRASEVQFEIRMKYLVARSTSARRASCYRVIMNFKALAIPGTCEGARQF